MPNAAGDDRDVQPIYSLHVSEKNNVWFDYEPERSRALGHQAKTQCTKRQPWLFKRWWKRTYNSSPAKIEICIKKGSLALSSRLVWYFVRRKFETLKNMLWMRVRRVIPTRQTKQDLQSHKHAICAPPSLWISRPSLANAAHGHEPSMKRQRSKDQNFKDKNSTHPWGLRRNSTIWLVQIGLYDKISTISIMSLSSLIGSDRCQDRDTRGEWRFQ